MTVEIFLTFVSAATYEQRRNICYRMFYLGLAKSGKDQWIAEGLDRCDIRPILEFFSKSAFPSKHAIIKEFSISIY